MFVCDNIKLKSPLLNKLLHNETYAHLLYNDSNYIT